MCNGAVHLAGVTAAKGFHSKCIDGNTIVPPRWMFEKMGFKDYEQALNETGLKPLVSRSIHEHSLAKWWQDHADVRNLHRIAMNILENAIEKQTTFKVVSEIKT